MNLKQLFFLFAIHISVGSFAQKGWQEFSSEQGHFRVMVPGPMEQKEHILTTDVGDLLYTTYLHQPETKDPDNIYYSISYVDYPENSIHSDSTEFLENFFHHTIDASVKAVMGELRYVDVLKINGYPGRLYRVDYKEGSATIKTRIYMVGSRFYQVQVVMQRSKSLNKAQDKFFDSFDIEDF
jgi:hypothetical protein